MPFIAQTLCLAVAKPPLRCMHRGKYLRERRQVPAVLAESTRNGFPQRFPRIISLLTEMASATMNIFLGNLAPALLTTRTAARNRKMRLETPFAFIIMRVKRDHKRGRERREGGGPGGERKGAGGARTPTHKAPKCEMPERDHCKILGLRKLHVGYTRWSKWIS